MWGSIIYFFAVTLGLGFLIDLIVKDWKADFFEKIVMRIGVGLLVFPVLGLLLNLAHIPLDWKIFLSFAIAVILACYYFRRESIISDFKFNFSKINKNQIYTVLVLILFGITAYMYIHGSFVYPWLEDGDPYNYALASKYIAEEKTFSTPYRFDHFAEPYAQGYNIIMGVLHQTNDSLYWSMKLFNALIISLSILFFYFFAKNFTKNRNTALIGTFALFAIPCWVGHFVFSLSMNMALFPVILYILSIMREDFRWKYLLGIGIGSVIFNHTYTGVTITGFVILYYLNKVFVEENLNRDIIQALLIGFFIPLLFYVPGYIKHSYLMGLKKGIGGMHKIFEIFTETNPLFLYGFIIVFIALLLYVYFRGQKIHPFFSKILEKKNMKLKIFAGILVAVLLLLIIPTKKFLNIRGTATRSYVLNDFFIAQKSNMINNPIGVGLVLMTLFCIGMIFAALKYKRLFDKKNFWISTSFIWSIVALLIIFGNDFSITYIPFRMWTFFAIFAAIIAGFAGSILMGLLKSPYLKIGFLILLVVIIIPTSFSQKYAHNTAIWPEHKIMVKESQDLYVWMREGGLPKDSAVFPLCIRESVMYGYDMSALSWRQSVLNRDQEAVTYLNSLNKSVDTVHDFLKQNDYEYTVLGASCIAALKVDQNLLKNQIDGMVNSSSFTLVKNTQSEFLFRVN